jgi:nucleoside phosphorylase
MKREDYTIGWICALPKEQAAAQLDEYHDQLSAQRHDPVYVLGRVNAHNVVISCLPTMGTNAAARCSAYLQSSFPSLRFILMVGIGGGVPTKHDIRLGDVVVSMPTKKYRGVVQYDFGTKFQDKRLVIRDTSLNRPPDLLITAAATLETRAAQNGTQNSLGRRLLEYVDDLVTKHPNMSSSRRPHVDQLFQAGYLHLDDSQTCDQCGCSIDHLQERLPRSDDYPHVHHGLIASGNQVMRDAHERDRLANEIDVLCFEMEGGGLMTGLDSLVIRGICDYCDSHKNKDWQEYAAAVAAGYARELLKIIPPLQKEAQVEERGDARTGAVMNQQYGTGGQFNNFVGNISTSGGKAHIGGHYESQGGAMNF